MNIWHDIEPDRITKDNFFSVIEIPKGSKMKYELDKKTGMLMLDRVLYTSTHYPANYGFIPRTYAEDGDPLDVLVLCSEAIYSLALVKCYPIGVISMLDNGAIDDKISELPRHIFDEMSHFFRVYKQLEGKETAIDEIKDSKAAVKIVEKCIDRYIDYFCKGKPQPEIKAHEEQPAEV